MEEAGRRARYRILEAEALCGRKTAGTMSIYGPSWKRSAETISSQPFRGSGLKGLSGIPPVRGRIIRPILWAQRREILDWLRAHGYPYVEDSTNSGTDYTRNLIRNELLPVITSRINGQAVQNILRGRRTYLRGGPVSGKDGRRVGCASMPLTAAGNPEQKTAKETAVFMAAELLKEDRIIRRYAVRIILGNWAVPLKRYYSQAYRQCPGTLGKGDRGKK